MESILKSSKTVMKKTIFDEDEETSVPGFGVVLCFTSLILAILRKP